MSYVLTQADEMAANPLDPAVDAAETIARVAGMSDLEYDRVREEEAKRLGIRVGTLDKHRATARKEDTSENDMGLEDVDPWPSPVAGDQVLDEIVATIRRHIIADEPSYPAAALWSVLTWAIEVVQVAPIAAITSPEKGCGKTQMLTLIGKLSRRPIPASNISSAALFRAVDAWQPTLLIDEADAFMRENEELRGIINAGHTRDTAFVVRVVGDDHKPVKFTVWGAKAIAGIGHLPETIEDRALQLRMRRKTPDERVARLRHADPEHFETLKAKIARFVDDNADTIQRARPALPEELADRAQDNWEPLLAIADAAGGHWPDTARRAAIILSGSAGKSRSIGAELLADIRDCFETRQRERIGSAELLDMLCEDEEAPWATYNRGKPLSSRQLSTRLREYGIRSGSVRFGNRTVKGFRRDQFADAFARYLDTSSPSGTTAQPSENAAHSVPAGNRVPAHSSPSGTTAHDADEGFVPDSAICAGTQNQPGTRKPAPESHCAGVPAGDPCAGRGEHDDDGVVI